MSKHLLILGGGTAAVSAATDMVSRGGTATIIHEGLPLGGCCLHVGCVPSKYLIRAAEQVHLTQHSPFPGLKPRGVDIDPASLFSDLRAKVTELRERNYQNPLPQMEGITLIRGWGKIASPTSVEVNGQVIQGDAILIATGSRTNLAGTEHLSDDLVLRNENFFDLNQLPESVIMLGGGYIAVELSQVMTRLGVKVTTLQRSGHVLSSQPAYLGKAWGEGMKKEGLNLICNVDFQKVEAGEKGVIAYAQVDGKPQTFTAEKVFMSKGRLANTDRIGLERIGIETRKNGSLDVNDRMQTACPTVYAAGDVLGGHMLVYTASAEAERVVADLFGEAPSPWQPESIPWVVFSDPQIAGVGLSGEEAREQGIEVEEAELPVNRWPRFSTANQDFGFLKMFRHPQTDTLIGARAFCPEAGDLMSELSLIMRYEIPLKEIANSLVPYLTLTEGIQRCAAKFYG
ncbi:NAD(P)/FAD-dependent oxidoreductase [Kiritimatiellaeota bacterium B1221]|nr:NAD(P)/FAD-dependent oxidoreductase [Kiritimatiellaeota bacterium B1221]